MSSFGQQNSREEQKMSSRNIEWFITKSESVPVWHKVALSVDEMYAYTSIGRETIRGLTKLPEAKQFTIKIGKRTLIKRKRFEEFLEQKMCIRDRYWNGQSNEYSSKIKR